MAISQPPRQFQSWRTYSRADFFADVEVGRLQGTRCAGVQRLAILNVFGAADRSRQTLCEKGERKLVLLVTERRCDFLEKRSSRPCASIWRESAWLCRRRNCAAASITLDAFLGQILQRRLTATGRAIGILAVNASGKVVGSMQTCGTFRCPSVRVKNARSPALRTGEARCLRTQDSSRSMCFPAPIDQVEFDVRELVRHR